MERSNFIYGLTKFWWIPLITGLAFIGFGVWCLCNPVESLKILAYIFAGALGAVGIFNLIFGFANITSSHGWGWAVACGIIEILCSIWLFFLPSPLLTSAFIFAMGIYIIFVSVNAIGESFMMSGYASFWLVWLMLLLFASIIFSCIFLAGPIVGGIAVWLWIGISFICYGTFRVLFSLKIKRINNNFNNLPR